MGRISLSGLITSIDGSIGNATIQRSGYGHTLRNKPSPTGMPSNSQSTVRTFISYLQYQWASMTWQQRNLWDYFSNYINVKSKHNPSVRLRGYQLFLKHNLMLLNCGQPIIIVIQWHPNAFQDTTGSFYWDADEFAYIPDEGYDEAHWIPLCKCTPPVKPHIKYFKNLLTVMQPDLSVPEYWNFYDVYMARYGQLPVPPLTAWFTFQFVHKLMPACQAAFTVQVI